jgi:hypothetical protein
MTTELAVKDRSFGPLLGRARRFVFGPPLPARLPERVQTTIRQEQDQTEILVSLLQLLAVASFAALYTLTPKAFDPQMVPFEPVPVTLAVYTGFTLVRLWLAWQRRLQAWFLALSVVVDISVLMVTIWSFHLQYQEPPPLYLKAPTILYAFILIALRTLRFESRGGAARRDHRRGRLAAADGVCGVRRGRRRDHPRFRGLRDVLSGPARGRGRQGRVLADGDSDPHARSRARAQAAVSGGHGSGRGDGAVAVLRA